MDTNAIIYAFDEKHETAVELEEVHSIIRHALGGRVNLALTTAMSRDLENDPDDERRAKVLNAVAMFPAIGAPARLGVTRLGGGDVLGSDNEAEVATRIERIVFPTGIDPDSRRWKNKANDVDHLVAHWRAGRDIFVTTDGPILRRAEALEDELGIRVMSPATALDLVERTVDVALTAEDFLSHFRELAQIHETILKQQPREVSSAEQDRYASLRDWLLRAWPKIQRQVGAYRVQRIATPALSGQVMASRFALAAINNDPNPFEKYYERESLGATLSRVIERAQRLLRDGTTPADHVLEDLENGRTLLTGLVGYLEANAP